MTARTVRIEVAPDDAGLRLDQVLARHIPELSRRKARVLIDIGGVFLDRARVKVASRPVRPGQVIEVHLGGALERAAGDVGAEARARDDAELPAYRIVHEDDDLIIVDKPAGLVTAPTPESDRGNLVDLLARRPGTGRVFLVHRIDLPTSGLLVFARTPEANRALGQRFSVHDIERAYQAVVAGAWPDELTTIDRPIQGKRAVSHITVAERLPGATRLTVTLETGRSHQIRIHAAGAGHPLLGDTQHGGEVSRRFATRPPRLALHAAVLGFIHPRTGERVRFEAPLPDDLASWLERLRGGLA